MPGGFRLDRGDGEQQRGKREDVVKPFFGAQGMDARNFSHGMRTSAAPTTPCASSSDRTVRRTLIVSNDVFISDIAS